MIRLLGINGTFEDDLTNENLKAFAGSFSSVPHHTTDFIDRQKMFLTRVQIEKVSGTFYLTSGFELLKVFVWDGQNEQRRVG